MNKKENPRTHRGLWGCIYVTVFAAVFIISAILKLRYNPLSKKYSITWNESAGTVYTNLFYGESESNTFDLYIPENKRQETYGLVVYLHAGGFTSGDKSDDAEILKRLCSMGYAAAGINYTLGDDNHPDVSVYSQSLEVKSSIPRVIEEAEKLGCKVNRMAIAGGSAGGTLALLYAYRDAETSPVPVKMVFEMVGPASFHHQDWTSYGLDKNSEAAANLFSVMSGNTITEDMIKANDYADELKNISAYMWINENTVPTLCAYGAYDKICPFGSSKYLINALEENNVPYDYIEFPHSGHGLQNDNDLYVQYIEKLEEYLDVYLAH